MLSFSKQQIVSLRPGFSNIFLIPIAFLLYGALNSKSCSVIFKFSKIPVFSHCLYNAILGSNQFTNEMALLIRVITFCLFMQKNQLKNAFINSNRQAYTNKLINLLIKYLLSFTHKYYYQNLLFIHYQLNTYIVSILIENFIFKKLIFKQQYPIQYALLLLIFKIQIKQQTGIALIMKTNQHIKPQFMNKSQYYINQNHINNQQDNDEYQIDNRSNDYDNRVNDYDNRVNGYDNRINGYDNRVNGYDNRLNDYQPQHNSINLSYNHYDNFLINAQVKSNFISCMFEQKQNKLYCIPIKVKILIEKLIELLKQLCLTKNSIIQVQQDLGKILSFYNDTLQNDICRNINQNPIESSLSMLSDIRMRTLNQQNDDANVFYAGAKLFTAFFEPNAVKTSYNLIKLSSYQKDLFQQFMQGYTLLLEKQICRISKYKGQKKLKYLLQTILKQIFSLLMQITFQLKIQELKSQANQPSQVPSVQILTSTISRILKQKQLLTNAFKSIQIFNKRQNKQDNQLISKFQTKITYLNHLRKVNQRKDIRNMFFIWRKESHFRQRIQKQSMLHIIDNMVRSLISEFAQHSFQPQLWKQLIWNKLNELAKTFCPKQTCLFLPVSSYQPQLCQQSSFISHCSSLKSPRTPQSDNPNSSLLNLVYQTFSIDEIKQCLRCGQILLRQIHEVRIVIVPIRNVGGVLVIAYQDICKQKDIDKASLQGVLKVLNNISPIVLQLIQLQQKFQYLKERVESKNFHKIILNKLLQPHSQQQAVINQSQTNSSIKPKCNIISIFSQRSSNTYRSLQETNTIQMIKSCFQTMGVDRVFLYHKDVNNTQGYYNCLGFQCQNGFVQHNNTQIGKGVVDAIFFQFNKNHYNLPFVAKNSNNKFTNKTNNVLPIKRNGKVFYACPIYSTRPNSIDPTNNQPVSICTGFIEIHFSKDYFQINENQRELQQASNSTQIKFISKKLIKNKQFEDSITLLSQSIISILIQEKYSRNQDQRQNQQCMLCLLQLKKHNANLHYKMTHKNVNQANVKIQSNLNQNMTYEQIYTLLYIKKDPSFCHNQTMLTIQQQIYNKILNKNNTQTLENFCSNFDQNFSKKQKFMRIIYTLSPSTKDGRIFQTNKQIKLKNQMIGCEKHQNLYSYFSTQNHQKTNIQLSFIDRLALFTQLTFKENTNNTQYIDLPLSKIIQVYKKLIRIVNKSQTTPNDFEKFLCQLLKSVSFKANKQNNSRNKQNNSSIQQNNSTKNQNTNKKNQFIQNELNLLFYQLQHFNQVNPNKKILFRINIQPVFSYLSKNEIKSKNPRYLTAIICYGMFIQTNNFQNIIFNSYVHQLSNVFGKIMEIKYLSHQDNRIPLNDNTNLVSNTYQIQSIHISNDIKTKINIYKRQQSKGYSIVNKFIKAIISLEKIIISSKNIKIKQVCLKRFQSNTRHQYNVKLQKFTCVLAKQIKSPQTRNTIYNNFLNKLIKFNNQKTQIYLKNIIQFQCKMSKIFITQKIYHNFINRIQNMHQSNICREFAISRIYQNLSNKLYGWQDQKAKQQSMIKHVFNQLKSYSNYILKIRLVTKKQALLCLRQSLIKICSKNGYLLYFKQLITLQSALYDNIALIGTQIDFIKFYSFTSFLKFINQRISIIFKSSKSLINILYGQSNLQVQFYLLFKSTNTNQQYKIVTSSTCNKERSSDLSFKILLTHGDNQQVYLCFSFKQEVQTNRQNGCSSISKISELLRKVIQCKIKVSFETFLMVYLKKLQILSSSLQSIIFSTPLIPSQSHILKSKAFTKLHSQFILNPKLQQQKQLLSQVQRKTQQHQQLYKIYNEKAIQIMGTQDLNGQVNKQMIRNIRDRIQILEDKEQAMEVQYQIRSKMTAANQIAQYLRRQQTRQAIQEVANNLINTSQQPYQPLTRLPNTSQQLYQPQNRSSNRKLPISENLLLKQKQKLSYLKATQFQNKNIFSQKFKKCGIRSIVKTIQNNNVNCFRKIFYKINSYGEFSRKNFVYR